MSTNNINVSVTIAMLCEITCDFHFWISSKIFYSTANIAVFLLLTFILKGNAEVQLWISENKI